MKKIRNRKELELCIRQLEEKKILQERLIAAAFNTLKSELKPMNLLRSTWKNLKSSPEYRSDMLENAASLGMNVILNKLSGRESRSWISSILLAGAQLGLDKTTLLENDKMRAWGTAIYKGLFSRKATARH
jgi:hypothetical protein